MNSIVVAYGQNREIGASGELPWGQGGLPADLRRFKRLTAMTSMIMGRATFDSIGHVLPGPRQTIVVSRQPDLRLDADSQNAVVAHSLAEAYASAEYDDITVIGGAAIFAVALADAAHSIDCVYATEVRATFPQADTFFPRLDSADWTEADREAYAKDGRNHYDYDFVTYARTINNT